MVLKQYSTEIDRAIQPKDRDQNESNYLTRRGTLCRITNMKRTKEYWGVFWSPWYCHFLEWLCGVLFCTPLMSMVLVYWSRIACTLWPHDQSALGHEGLLTHALHKSSQGQHVRHWILVYIINTKTLTYSFLKQSSSWSFHSNNIATCNICRRWKLLRVYCTSVGLLQGVLKVIWLVDKRLQIKLTDFFNYRYKDQNI